MKLYYYTQDINFGDRLNAWLWERLLPGYWTGEGPLFVAIGTLLGRRLPAAQRIVVFSSGAGYSGLPRLSPATLDVACVRGPLSARVLGLPASAAVTDGAALLATLAEYTPVPPSRRSGIVFMPHHAAEDTADSAEACKRAGIEYLSPRADSRQAVERLRYAELVLADAMHAAVVADALRVPWIPVVSSKRINAFKWLDWTASLRLPYAPSILPPCSLTASLGGRFLRLTGEDHYFPERDQAAALRHFWAKHALHENTRKRWRQRIYARGLARALKGFDTPPLSRWRAARDEACIAAVAAALRAAAQRPPFLSHDALFAARVVELARRLEKVAGKYAPPRSPRSQRPAGILERAGA